MYQKFFKHLWFYSDGTYLKCLKGVVIFRFDWWVTSLKSFTDEISFIRAPLVMPIFIVMLAKYSTILRKILSAIPTPRYMHRDWRIWRGDPLDTNPCSLSFWKNLNRFIINQLIYRSWSWLEKAGSFINNTLLTLFSA